MKSIVRSTVFAVVLTAAIGVVMPVTLVEAAPRFHGTYAWTGARSCVLANQPFVGPTFLIPTGAFVSRTNSSESGTITFNIDGTGVTEGRASFMTLAVAGTVPGTAVPLAAGAGLSVAEFENHFTFVVKPDATIETDSIGVTAVTVLGTGTGGTSTGIGLRNRFQIVRGDMLVSAPQTQIHPEQVFLLQV